MSIMLNTIQLVILGIAIVFFLISFYTLFRGIKRDKIISISTLTICLIVFLSTVFMTNFQAKKAKKYFGIYELVNYQNSNEFMIEICPNKEYYIYNKQDTVTKGIWDYQGTTNNLELLLIDGQIFGLNDLEIISKNSLKSKKKLE